MKFCEAEIYLPVDRYVFHVTTETPRAPTAFEWAAVKIVHDFHDQPAYAAATVADVFRTALGGAGTESFLETALDELFSSTTNALATDDHSVSPIHLPISSIRLTEDGTRMIETGVLPSAPKREVRRIVYDPITHQLMKDEVSTVQPPAGAAQITLAAGDEQAPADLVRARETAQLKKGSVVGRVEAQGPARRDWRRQRVGFLLEDGRVTLDRTAFSLSPELAAYLSALTPDRARELFFAPLFGANPNGPSAVTQLPATGVVQVCPDTGRIPFASESVPLVVCGANCPDTQYVAQVAEIRTGASAGAVWEKDAPAAVTVLEELVPPGTACDGRRMTRHQRIRCFYGDLPIELPVVVETELTPDEQQAFGEKVGRVIAGLPVADRLRLVYQMGENHEQRKQAVASVVASTTGADRFAVLKALLDDLHARAHNRDPHAVIDGIFGLPGLAGFADADEAQALADALPLTDDEKRWAKNWLRRACAVQSVTSGSPEDQFVRIEESSKNRPSRGRNRHGKHKRS